MSANQHSDTAAKPFSFGENSIRQDVQSMHAYAIRDASGMVKLDANWKIRLALSVELQARLGQTPRRRWL
jgi:histidinol-phosphate aminotransferase